jgi:hypothetical protein
MRIHIDLSQTGVLGLGEKDWKNLSCQTLIRIGWMGE